MCIARALFRMRRILEREFPPRVKINKITCRSNSAYHSLRMRRAQIYDTDVNKQKEKKRAKKRNNEHGYTSGIYISNAFSASRSFIVIRNPVRDDTRLILGDCIFRARRVFF